ncbi:putative transposase-like protein, partial [Stegodyphus mimosarum]
MLDFVCEKSEKIGGKDKVVEIDESKFRKRKYNRDHRVEGQWVFGGVERGTGRLFLVAVHDRSMETLMRCIEEWIESGTTIYSDGWKSCKDLGKEGFEHLTVNHSINFMDSESGCHINTIESTWRHVKASLPSYNRKSDFEFYLAVYIFYHFCFEVGEDSFNIFVEFVRNVRWEERKISL